MCYVAIALKGKGPALVPALAGLPVSRLQGKEGSGVLGASPAPYYL